MIFSSFFKRTPPPTPEPETNSQLWHTFAQSQGLTAQAPLHSLQGLVEFLDTQAQMRYVYRRHAKDIGELYYVEALEPRPGKLGLFLTRFCMLCYDHTHLPITLSAYPKLHPLQADLLASGRGGVVLPLPHAEAITVIVRDVKEANPFLTPAKQTHISHVLTASQATRLLLGEAHMVLLKQVPEATPPPLAELATFATHLVDLYAVLSAPSPAPATASPLP